MFSVSWIVSVSIFIVSFLGIVFAAKFLAKPVDEYKVSFLRMFPFEMARTAENNGKFYSFSAYLFAGLCFSPLIVIIDSTTNLSNLNPLSIFIACLFGLTALCFVFLNIFDATHVKAHLSLFGIFALLTFLSSSLVSIRGFIAWDIFNKHGSQEYLLLVTSVIVELIAVFVLILIFNPKLKTWAVLDMVDGKYVRPKKFVLAYSEWGVLLSLFLSELIYFIQLLVK